MATHQFAKPTKPQLEWAEQEVGVIIHYVMDIYNVEKCDKIKTKEVRTEMPPSIFAPEGWDVDQWMRSAKEAGAKYAVLVANHCTGFSLWPTKANDYSVASCAYKDGKGDIVREFVDACKKYDIKPGLYYSTGCNGYYDINDAILHDYKSPEYQAYVRVVEQQIEELWSQYGDMFEIWFDGGNIPVEEGGPHSADLLKKYQPDAVAFQGPAGHPHNLRWVGNESGLASYDCFSSITIGAARPELVYDEDRKLLASGDPFGESWVPAETDMPNRDHLAYGGGWGWAEGEEDKVYTPEHLLDRYINSVGRNSNLLIGMAIAKNGRFEDEQQFIDFGKLIEKTFGDEAKLAEVKGSADPVQTVTLDEAKPISYIVIREDITEGHRVLGFRVLIDGEEILNAHCIGHKRIIEVEGKVGKTVTVEITESRDTPVLRDIAVY